jgi:hypothetical protein
MGWDCESAWSTWGPGLDVWDLLLFTAMEQHDMRVYVTVMP